jgi:hypothetical protein
MRTTKNITKNPDLRELLLNAGVGQYTASMSVPYLNMLPSTTDPYAQGVIQIVQGLQRLLNKRGARLEVDGGLGGRTVGALTKFAGPRWYDKSWAQLLGDVESGGKWQGWDRQNRAANPQGVGDFMEDLGADGYYGTPVPIYSPGTIAVAKMQIAINRLVPKYAGNPEFPLVGIDGQVGPKTLTILRRIAAAEMADSPTFGTPLTAMTGSASSAAASAANITMLLDAQSQAEKLPPLQLVATGPFKPGDKSAPSAPPAGTPGLPPPSSDFVSMLKSPLGLAAIAVGGLLIVSSNKPKKTKRGRR